MTAPRKIKPRGSDITYVLESVAPNKNGEKVTYKDNVYVKEELPAEYVMFEGVAFKRGMSLNEYNRKAMMESANKKIPNKIKIKGTDIVLEAISDSDSKVAYTTGEDTRSKEQTFQDAYDALGAFSYLVLKGDVSGQGLGPEEIKAANDRLVALGRELLAIGKTLGLEVRSN